MPLTTTNEAEIKGKWNQLKGKVKEQFGNLTDDDLMKADGSVDRLIGVLQERYGYTKEQAQREWNRFIDQYDLSSANLNEKSGSMFEDVTHQAKEVAGNAFDQGKKMVNETVDHTLDRTDAALREQKQKAANKLDNVASAMRSSGRELRKGEQETFAQYADSAAEYVEDFSNFLRTRHPMDLWNDVQSFAYRKPEVFVLGTLAAGFLLGRFLHKSEPRGEKISHAGQVTPDRYQRPAVNHSARQKRYDRNPSLLNNSEEQSIQIQGSTSDSARQWKEYATKGGTDAKTTTGTPPLATPTRAEDSLGYTRKP